MSEALVRGQVSREDFESASKAAESWFSRVSLIADFGKTGNVEDALFLLMRLQADFNRHIKSLSEAMDSLMALSDSSVEWEHGRGLSAIARCPSGVFPHVWSSAHEAARGIARMTLDLLLPLPDEFDPFLNPSIGVFQGASEPPVPFAGNEDPVEQREIFTEILTHRWKALVIPIDEVAKLRERVCRERAKLLHALPSDRKQTKKTKPRNSDRDKRFKELADSGKSNKQIAGIWNEEHGDDNVSEDAVKKAVQRYRDKKGHVP